MGFLGAQGFSVPAEVCAPASADRAKAGGGPAFRVMSTTRTPKSIRGFLRGGGAHGG